MYESVEGVECISGKSCREERKAEREVTLRELEIREKELALSKRDLEEKIKLRPKVYLPNFIEGEDIEVFLKSFEKLANCYKWDKTEWAIRLVPKLSGKALETYLRMPVSTSDDYELVKQAILERYGLYALAYRDKFRLAKQTDLKLLRNMPIELRAILNI